MGRQIQQYPSEPTTGINKRCSRRNNHAADDDGGVECSGKSCQSCTARVIADCVAVCCCPCAVINFFTLTFLKLPWMMGRKCLGKLRNKKKKKKLKYDDDDDDDDDDDKDEISRTEQGENGESVKVTAIDDDEEEECKYSARFEAERVWLEMYRVDNLGFGRVSFTGIQSLG